MDEQSKKGVADDSGCTYWRAFAFAAQLFMCFLMCRIGRNWIFPDYLR